MYARPCLRPRVWLVQEQIEPAILYTIAYTRISEVSTIDAFTVILHTDLFEPRVRP